MLLYCIVNRLLCKYLDLSFKTWRVFFTFYILLQQIDLPHGGSVIINKNKIEIKSSELDYDKTEGLCGNINGDRSDDFEGLSQSDFANKWR